MKESVVDAHTLHGKRIDFNPEYLYREAIVKNEARASGKQLFVSVTGLRLHYAGCETVKAGLKPANPHQIGSLLMCWNCHRVDRTTLKELSRMMAFIADKGV
jgi:hypothetical protein